MTAADLAPWIIAHGIFLGALLFRNITSQVLGV